MYDTPLGRALAAAAPSEVHAIICAANREDAMLVAAYVACGHDYDHCNVGQVIDPLRQQSVTI